LIDSSEHSVRSESEWRGFEINFDQRFEHEKSLFQNGAEKSQRLAEDEEGNLLRHFGMIVEGARHFGKISDL
jgi:hypothetical protein